MNQSETPSKPPGMAHNNALPASFIKGPRRASEHNRQQEYACGNQQRLTLRWAESLERMAALRPEVLLTEFGAIIDGESEVQERLHQTAKALRWLRDEVVSRLNQGLKEEEILVDLSYPPNSSKFRE